MSKEYSASRTMYTTTYGTPLKASQKLGVGCQQFSVGCKPVYVWDKTPLYFWGIEVYSDPSSQKYRGALSQTDYD